MFETQLTNLIQELNRSTGKRYSLHRLLNDTDYRNHCLHNEKTSAAGKVLLLVNQIQALEDLLAHELRVDLLQHSHEQQRPRWGLTALGLASLLFITISVVAVEEYKPQPLVESSTQAD